MKSVIHHSSRVLRKRALAFIVGSLLFLLSSPWTHAQSVRVLTVSGAITPTVASYIQRGIQTVTDESCVVIKLDTPGGLLKSTRAIVGNIMDSRIPVIVYVSPSGAQAASAGTFITMSAHIAAMTPGTNIGAASVISMQGGMDSVSASKANNDAIAFIRSISELRKRNSSWAERSVSEAASLPADAAVDSNVVDFLAIDLTDLLKKADGRIVYLQQDTLTLKVASAEVRFFEMGFIERLLDILSDPNIAYILFLLGIYGLFFELYNPGSILPGVIGGIAIILALYALHTLPINYAGLGLIIFAIILFLLEIKVTSYGILSIGGVISFVLGSLMLIRDEPGTEFMELSLSVILFGAALTAAFFLTIVGLGLKAQRSKPSSGAEGMIGLVGIAETPIETEGNIFVHGESWFARSEGGRIEKGSLVIVTKMEGLTLIVQPKQKP